MTSFGGKDGKSKDKKSPCNNSDEIAPRTPRQIPERNYRKEIVAGRARNERSCRNDGQIFLRPFFRPRASNLSNAAPLDRRIGFRKEHNDEKGQRTRKNGRIRRWQHRRHRQRRQDHGTYARELFHQDQIAVEIHYSTSLNHPTQSLNRPHYGYESKTKSQRNSKQGRERHEK